MTDAASPERRIVSTFPVLGISTQFDTNSEDVSNTVLERFGGWELLPAALVNDALHPRVRIDVVSGRFDDSDPAPVVLSCPDATRIVLRSPQCIGVSDPPRRDAAALVSPGLVSDRNRFRDTVLDALTFALLSHFDRHPIHAAGIARNGLAVLLAGPSGSGKSTLAHGAHADGWSVLNDDHVWIETKRTFHVWGAPGTARLLRSDAAGETPPSKNSKSLVELGGTRRDLASYVADRATVCVLTRGSEATLERVGRDVVYEALVRRVDPGFDRFPERHVFVADTLAANGGWRLTLTRDPRAALALLRTISDAT